MAWVPVQDSLPEHPKTKRLARRWGVSRAEVVGHLTMLWLWAVRYAPSGDLSALTDAEIAEAAGHEQREGSCHEGFVADLEEVGWLGRADDGRLVIHDWDEHLALYLDLLDQRAKATERKRKSRAKAKEVTGQSRDSHVTGHRTVAQVSPSIEQDQIQPNPNQQQPITPEEVAAREAFNRLDDWWAKMQGRAHTFSRDWEPMKEALALPGMTADRIIRELDPIIEAKRKKGERVSGFLYCLRVLESLVQRDKLAVSNGLVPASSVPTALPRIEDQDHYDFLVSSGIFNPADWANADEFEEAF